MNSARKRDGPGRRRKWRRLRIALLVLAVLLILPTISFVRAMTYPGSAPASVRAVEWFRDHGAGPIVDAIETWKYSRDQPPSAGKPGDSLGITGAPVTGGDQLPRVKVIAGSASTEGQWSAARSGKRGPLLYVTSFRPDAQHPTTVAGVALMPAGRTTLHLVSGTREPVPNTPSPEGYAVPSADWPTLLAAFNAGFKTLDAQGGWYAHGQTIVPLRTGDASVVIYRDGSTRVGAWGTEVSMTPDVVAVRQNLHMIVQGGAPVAGLQKNANGAWGTGSNQFQWTARSGVGTDARGDLIYVEGRQLTLAGLAQAMTEAGITSGMELDIHSAVVTFNAFDAVPSGSSRPAGHRLLKSMNRPTTRYLFPDQRDFFYVTER